MAYFWFLQNTKHNQLIIKKQNGHPRTWMVVCRQSVNPLYSAETTRISSSVVTKYMTTLSKQHSYSSSLARPRPWCTLRTSCTSTCVYAIVAHNIMQNRGGGEGFQIYFRLINREIYLIVQQTLWSGMAASWLLECFLLEYYFEVLEKTSLHVAQLPLVCSNNGSSPSL